MIDAKTPEGKHVVRCSWIRSLGCRKNFRFADSVSPGFKHKRSRMIDGNVAAVDHRCAKTLTGLASVLGRKVPIHQWEASIESEN